MFNVKYRFFFFFADRHESDCVVVEPGTDSVLEPVPDHLGASETENTIYGAKNSFEMLRGIEDLVSGRNLPSLLLKVWGNSCGYLVYYCLPVINSTAANHLSGSPICSFIPWQA